MIDGSGGKHACDDATGLCYCPDTEGYNAATCMPDVNGCTMCAADTEGKTIADFDGYP